MIALAQHLRTTLQTQTGVTRWWVGLSGGLDSTVLASLVSGLRLPQPVQCVYVHHGLSANASDWQQHCEQFCRALAIPFQTVAVTVESGGQGLEAAARAARYRAFEQLLEPGDCLLLGHHLDDQAETLLLRLMRGTGVQGLQGIRATRPLGAGYLLRPLLSATRGELESVAEQLGLSWIEDESNRDEHFDRNYVRQQVMPLLQARWPEFQRQWHRTAQHCGSAAQLLDEVAEEDLAGCQRRGERWGESLDLAAWSTLSHARRQHSLRYWVQQQGLSTPETVHLQELEKQLASPRADSTMAVRWGETTLQCYRDRLYCLPQLTQQPPEQALLWDGRAPLMWGAWRLSVQPDPDGWRLPQEGLLVRQRREGERCHPHHRAHSQTLKKLLQESGLPPWLRDQLPVLTSTTDAVIAVGDLWFCKGWQTGAEGGVSLQWQLAE